MLFNRENLNNLGFIQIQTFSHYDIKCGLSDYVQGLMGEGAAIFPVSD